MSQCGLGLCPSGATGVAARRAIPTPSLRDLGACLTRSQVKKRATQVFQFFQLIGFSPGLGGCLITLLSSLHSLLSVSRILGINAGQRSFLIYVAIASSISTSAQKNYLQQRGALKIQELYCQLKIVVLLPLLQRVDFCYQY